MSGPDNAHTGAPVVLHTHADANGNSGDDPHDEYDPKHNASNCSASTKDKKCSDDFLIQHFKPLALQKNII